MTQLNDIITLDVQLTEQHILNGMRCSCSFCPIASAIRDVVTCGLYIEVLHRSVSLHRDAAHATFTLPRNASAFISAFDMYAEKNMTPEYLRLLGIGPMSFTVSIAREFVLPRLCSTQ